MIQSRYLCPLCSESMSTTDASFASNKLWVKRAVAFMESHKEHSTVIKSELKKYYAEKENNKNK